MNQTVHAYVLADGKEPLEEWLADLKDKKGRARVRARINQIRGGNPGNEDRFRAWIPDLLCQSRKQNNFASLRRR